MAQMEYENGFIDLTLKRFKIQLDSKTVVYVNEKQITNPKWVKHFGSLAKIENFINTYHE